MFTRLAIAAFVLAPLPALAGGPAVTGADPVVYNPAPVAPRNALSFTLLGGVSVAPDYFGSKDYSAGPALGFSLNHLRFGSLEVGNEDPNAIPTGFGVHGSLRYIAKRKASKNPELAGLTDVKAALELGLGVGYSSEYFAAFADVRYGAVGHKGVAGELGADLILRPSDRLTLTAGPRVQFGNRKFTQTYFGVTPAEAGASTIAGTNLGAYNPGGGVYGAGLEIGAKYKLNNDWGVEGKASWTRLQGDAGRSPIVAQGDRDQFGVSIGLTRRVTFGF